MNNESLQCLYCYQDRSVTDLDFHASCSKKIFGSPTPVLLPFHKEEIEDLSKEVFLRANDTPGSRPKLSLYIERKASDQNHNYLRIVGLDGHFILKPHLSDIPFLPELIDLTYHLARIQQIKTATHSLIRLESGELAHIIQRLDRSKKGKSAMEDMCQLSGTFSEDKYQGSIERIGKLIFTYSSNPGFDAISLFDLTLFCYLTGCSDMHLKNFALITNKDNETSFSPAYDLVPSALLFQEGKGELALSVNNKKKNLTKNDFDSLAEKLKINAKTLDNIYKRFQKNIPSMLSFIEISFIDDKMKQQFKNLIRLRALKIFNIQLSDVTEEVAAEKAEIQEEKLKVEKNFAELIDLSSGEINDKPKNDSSKRQLNLFPGY